MLNWVNCQFIYIYLWTYCGDHSWIEIIQSILLFELEKANLVPCRLRDISVLLVFRSHTKGATCVRSSLVRGHGGLFAVFSHQSRLIYSKTRIFVYARRLRHSGPLTEAVSLRLVIDATCHLIVHDFPWLIEVHESAMLSVNTGASSWAHDLC